MNVLDFKDTINCESCTDKELANQWESIDWNKARTYINRLQIRIVKAVESNKKSLVIRLQYLITHSFYGKALAIKRVTTNKGKKSPGIDGVIWLTSTEKMKAISLLKTKGYISSPLKRVYIEKYGKKEKRPLSIPTIKDRAMQALYLLALEPISETKADLISFGFRKYRSAHDAQRHIHNLLSKKTSPQWIIEGDIKACFDEISHEWMLENIPMDKTILSKFLKSGFVFNGKLFPTTNGAAQGGVISPTIANVVLDGMEDAIAKKFWPSKKGRKDTKDKHRNGVNLIRFADDFIISSYSEKIAFEIIEVIEEFLEVRGLSLSKTKTKVTTIQEGFDFLGWNFRKYTGKLIVKPSSKSISKLYETLSKVLDKGKSSTQSQVIKRINQILRGWTNYHQSVCAKETFSKIDSILWGMLYHWAKRRHQKKSKHWIIQKYWKTVKSRKWIFKDENIFLINASDTPIVRHISLKLDINSTLNEKYFIHRRLKQQNFRKTAWKKTTAVQQKLIGL